MSGAIARRGFRFQDHYLIQRILMHIAERREALLSGEPVPASLTFGIETPLHGGNDSLDWDTLVIGTTQTEVIEVKSGTVDKADRHAFWRRLRVELLNSGDQHASIIPTLVISKEDSPTAVDAWRSLADGGAHGFVQTLPLPEATPTQVSTDEGLVKEALYWLCKATEIQYERKNGTPAVRELGAVVPEPIARAALQRFVLVEVPAAELHTQVEAILDALTVGPDAGAVRRQLAAWLDERATAAEGEIKQFDAVEVLREVKLLNRLLTGSPAAFNIARLIKRALSTACVEQWRQTLLDGGLQEIALAQSQPHLAQFPWSAMPSSVAVIGDGGQGKTRALYQVYQQLANQAIQLQVYPVSAESLADYLQADPVAGSPLLEALHLLADFAALKTQRVLLMVDGMDQVAKSVSSQMARLLNEASQHPAFRSIISCRRPDWNARGHLREHLSGWECLDLVDWSDDLVNSQLRNAGIGRNITNALRQLIRNPLYLDLLLRTFGPERPISSELQTRHGLFKAFWSERILKDDQDHRWAVLCQGCEALAKGERWQPLQTIGNDTEAIGHLLSVGLVVRVDARGRFDFRHPLLRDFAMGQWALAAGEPSNVRERVKQIKSPTVRFGAHRAVIEAISEESASPFASPFALKEYVENVSENELLDEVADILGELEPSPGMDPRGWASDLQVDVATRLFRSAQYHLNFSWCTTFVQWPNQPEWPSSQTWFGEEALSALVDYLGVVSRNTLEANVRVPAPALSGLASRIREWSKSRRYQNEFLQGSNLVARMIPDVARWAPDGYTIEWLQTALVSESWNVRMSILQALPILAQAIATQTPRLGEFLAVLYRKVIGFPEGDFHASTLRLGYPMMSHYAVDWSLIGVAGPHPGVSLLDALPREFLPVTLDLIQVTARREEEEARQSAARWVKVLAETLPPDISANQKPDAVEATEASLDSQGVNEIIDDRPEWYWSQHRQDDLRHSLVRALQTRLGRWLKEDSEWFNKVACPSIRQCPAATVQTLLIHFSLEVNSSPAIAKVVRPMVLNSSLYRCSGMLYWLQRLLAREWPTLTEEERTSVFQAIGTMLNGNPFRRLEAGELLRQIPASELPKNLTPLVEEVQTSGLSPLFPDPRRNRFTGPHPRPKIKINSAIVGKWSPPLTEEDMIQLYELSMALPWGDEVQPIAEELNLTTDTLVSMLPTLRNAADQILAQPLPLDLMERVITVYERHRGLAEVKPFSSDTLSAIADFGMFLLEKAEPPAPPPDLKAQRTRYQRDTWSRALSLLDMLLAMPELQNRKDLRDRLFAALARAYETHNPLAQIAALTYLRDWHWLRQDDSKAALLCDLLVRHVQAGPVLECAIGLIHTLHNVDHEAADNLVRALLQKGDVEAPETFAHLLGQFTGSKALVVLKSGNRAPAAILVEEITSTADRYPLMRQAEVEVEFLWGLVFGLNAQAQFSVEETHLVNDHARWLERLWESLDPLRDRRRDRPSNFMLFTLHWIDSPEEPGAHIRERRTWWSALRPLLRKVIGVGQRSDVYSTLFNLRGEISSEVAAPNDLFELVGSLVDRLQDVRGAEEGDNWNSWDEVASYASEVLHNACRRPGVPQRERDKGYDLLRKLAAEPIRSRDAHRRLVSLQSDVQ